MRDRHLLGADLSFLSDNYTCQILLSKQHQHGQGRDHQPNHPHPLPPGTTTLKLSTHNNHNTTKQPYAIKTVPKPVPSVIRQNVTSQTQETRRNDIAAV